MDETSKQLLRDARQPLPTEPSQPERRDYEYERGGVVNLFMFCEPLRGRRWVDVTERRTMTDWAHQMEESVDERYPEAERIVLVMGNLNTHTPASLYEAFSPAEAKPSRVYGLNSYLSTLKNLPGKTDRPAPRHPTRDSRDELWCVLRQALSFAR